jgi:AmmeMemoRadiSam system protein B
MVAGEMRSVRKPAVAGQFYPGDATELNAAVKGFLKDAELFTTPGENPPKALIVPHAGYVYSGAIAASAYARITDGADSITRVVLLGPAHRLPFEGLALPWVDGFQTPLGTVPLDADAVARIEHLPQVRSLPSAHEGEHSLEVHLPFLQVLVGEFSLVPLVVGAATAAQVAEVLEVLWGGDETLIVISTDLSHYYDYGTAKVMDAATSEAIEALDEKKIGLEDACGRVPLSGLLVAARAHGLAARTVDLRNSGDTAGPRNQVVGYGAYVVS